MPNVRVLFCNHHILLWIGQVTSWSCLKSAFSFLHNEAPKQLGDWTIGFRRTSVINATFHYFKSSTKKEPPERSQSSVCSGCKKQARNENTDSLLSSANTITLSKGHDDSVIWVLSTDVGRQDANFSSDVCRGRGNPARTSQITTALSQSFEMLSPLVVSPPRYRLRRRYNGDSHCHQGQQRPLGQVKYLRKVIYRPGWWWAGRRCEEIENKLRVLQEWFASHFWWLSKYNFLLVGFLPSFLLMLIKKGHLIAFDKYLLSCRIS